VQLVLVDFLYVVLENVFPEVGRNFLQALFLEVDFSFVVLLAEIMNMERSLLFLMGLMFWELFEDFFLLDEGN